LTLPHLESIIQASDEELRKGLKDRNVIEVDGTLPLLFLLSRSLLRSALYMSTCTIRMRRRRGELEGGDLGRDQAG
jgi:hypothetical protein